MQVFILMIFMFFNHRFLKDKPLPCKKSLTLRIIEAISTPLQVIDIHDKKKMKMVEEQKLHT